MLRECLRMSWDNIVHNKMRSFLTVLGIVIGVMAIIALITIVQGVTGEITDQFAALGTGKITVRITGTPLKSGLSDNELKDIGEIDNVSGVAPTVSASTTAVYHMSPEEDVAIEGRSDTYFSRNTSLIDRGRPINPLDTKAKNRVCVVDDVLREKLFFGEDPLGKTILLGGIRFTVVGTLDSSSDQDAMAQALGGGNDGKIIVPYTTAMQLTGSNSVTSLEVYVDDTDNTSQVINDLESLLNRAFNYRDDTYTVINMESLLDTMNTMMGMMTSLLAGIASIALLVGGIGIMNMMLVSVTERTTEIGLRKALGAEPGSIQMQFLMESIILSLMGGLLGMILGIAVSVAFSVWMEAAFRFSTSAITLGVGFSAAVGIIFGWAPAKKASALNPIDALRSV